MVIVIRKLLRRQLLLQLSALVCFIALGFFCRLTYQQFNFLQGQNISGLSVFNSLVMPLAGLTLLCQIIMAIVAASSLLPLLKSRQQKHLIEQSAISPLRMTSLLVAEIWRVSLWPFFYFTGLLLVIGCLSQLDLGRVLLTLVGLLIINLQLCCWVFALTSLLARPIAALLLSLIFVFLLLMLDSSIWFWLPQLEWQGIFTPFFRLREGLLSYADLLASGGWLLAGFTLCFWLLNRMPSWQQLHLWLPVCLILLFFVAANTTQKELDITQNQRNSFNLFLSEQLNEKSLPLKVTAVVAEGSDRDEILRGFDILQSAYPKSELSFLSRQQLAPNSQAASQYLEFSLDELNQAVAYPFDLPVKQVFEQAVSQLLKRKSQWITFIEGHGEASLFAKNTSDISQLYKMLTNMGWPVAAQNLAELPQLSDNTQLLVIAASKKSWLPAEVTLVLEYLTAGGNLLLLADPDSKLPVALSDYLGVSRYPGTLVDWTGYQGGTPHPAIVIVTQLEQHPLTSRLNSLLAFPWSSGLQITQPQAATVEPLKTAISTHKGVWNELTIDEEQLAFEEEKGELQQTFALVAASHNSANGQKIVVVGDSHFASDSAINNYANKQLALNLFSWMTNQADLEAAEQQHKDNYLQPSVWGRLLINWGFGLIFPLLIFMSYWLKRRRWANVKN